MQETKVASIIKQANKLTDRALARQIRKSALEVMIKMADERGILQHFQGTPAEFKSHPAYTVQRSGKGLGDKIYNTGPEHPKADTTMSRFDRSLSTRYSPDRVGVQARRVADGVQQDPITNKVYDWNEGFTTEDGEQFGGGAVSSQTDLLYER